MAQLVLDVFEGMVPSGDLVLVCSDSVSLRVHSQILMISSTVLRNTQNKTLKVEGSSSSWKLVLQQLYPLHPRPELSFTTIQSMLKIVHMYDMTSLLALLLGYLNSRFPAELSPDPSSPTWVMTWLGLADVLQLEELREMCMRKVRSLAYSGDLGTTLLQRVVPADGTQPLGDIRASGSWGSLRHVGSRSQRKSSDGGKADSAPIDDHDTWHIDDRPELHDSLRQLSRSTLEEMLASLAMAASKRYQNAGRTENS